MVRRIVFLSVPQWGTNIADWVRSYKPGRLAVVTELRSSVAASQLPLLDRVQDYALRGANCLTGSNLGLALQDALSEAEAPACGGDPSCTADAHEAASELGLWLRHMASDFHAIDDLASQAPTGTYRSPAHFPEKKRAEEIQRWGKRIKTRSYATLGRRPFRFDPGSDAPRWDLSNPWTYPECAKDDHTRRGHRYRISHRLPGLRRRPIPPASPGRRAGARAPELAEGPDSPLAQFRADGTLGQRRNRQHGFHVLAGPA